MTFETDKKKGRKVISRRFTVMGTGQFAFDMLRYDTACPLTEHDANTIGVDHLRSITLVRYAETFELALPTIRRWQSQGWTVREIEGRSGDMVLEVAR
jgi:hypothetical protein